ncbi:hypothetical protein FXF53_26010 [Micromonospora sp. WP24]|uniref:hypothetical protein n=1 Tax=Micromonospora sp. WP24 TaxID=2604469 RepID=UPI0011D83583|nr:hypothetical protein [Micromonospora sp. WP24]TYB95006.1 hypothetical protein FXF53_26010 [Micromonospora sp. WP24]
MAMLVEEKDRFWSLNGVAGSRAAESTDPAVSAAGRELVLAVKEAGELDVGSDFTADTTESEARIGEAQQKLMTACRELLGEPPWPSQQD